jgi:hypothetical protein
LIIRLAAGYPPADVIRWSRWRRRHQAIARVGHMNRRRAVLGEQRSL